MPWDSQRVLVKASGSLLGSASEWLLVLGSGSETVLAGEIGRVSAWVAESQGVSASEHPVRNRLAGGPARVTTQGWAALAPLGMSPGPLPSPEYAVLSILRQQEAPVPNSPPMRLPRLPLPLQTSRDLPRRYFPPSCPD